MTTYDPWFSRYALRNKLMFFCRLFSPAVGRRSYALSTFFACSTQRVNHLQEKLKRLWTLKPDISIDKAMVPIIGRLGIKQFISNKPVHFGIKLWKLWESATGYCYKFDVYIEKSKEADDPLALRKSAIIVMSLVKGLEHKN